MTNWLANYRDSVSWGDEIRAQKISSRDGSYGPVDCCWFYSGDRLEKCHYCVPGDLKDMNKAITDGLVVKQSTNCSTSILFTNKEATEAQVEEALHTAGNAGLACGFLEAKPTLLWYGLLDKYSEGTLMEQALKVMQEAGE
ncbi:hypothetical protein N9T35_00670 [bacterium]|nr:hypothetical protein [bacterium]